MYIFLPAKRSRLFFILLWQKMSLFSDILNKHLTCNCWLWTTYYKYYVYFDHRNKQTKFQHKKETNVYNFAVNKVRNIIHMKGYGHHPNKQTKCPYKQWTNGWKYILISFQFKVFKQLDKKIFKFKFYLIVRRLFYL